MKYQLQILIFVLLCLVGKLDASSLYDYGLHLKSHTVSAIERTSLFLDDNQPFPIKNDFTISFQMYIRANEPDFGSILHLYTNTNQYIRFLFVAGGERNFSHRHSYRTRKMAKCFYTYAFEGQCH